ESRGRRLEIELAGLRQVGLLVIRVLRLEKTRRALAGRGRQDRRIDAGVAARVEEVVDRALDLAAHLEDGDLLRRAQPEVPLRHEEVDAVLLRRDRPVVAEVEDRNGRDGQLHAAGRARVCLHEPGHFERGFLRRAGRGFPHGLGHVGLRDDALEIPAPVAQDQEPDLPALPPVVEPSLEGDGPADMRLETGNRQRVFQESLSYFGIRTRQLFRTTVACESRRSLRFLVWLASASSCGTVWARRSRTSFSSSFARASTSCLSYFLRLTGLRVT